MTDTPHHHRTSGNPELDVKFEALLDELEPPRGSRDQLFEMLVTIAELSVDGVERLDAKIANAALQEMAHAFRVFAPYRSVPKVTMFGSARTLPNDPLYAQARDVARALAAEGWMVVTGAGPGIMAAGLEGAGRKQAMGINIRLPFEQGANEFIAKDPKLVEMRYFFTRKLMLMKESDGFVVLPGGFGTLDEGYELLTLLQTGKAEPAPVVMLELPGGTYWSAWDTFLREQVAPRGLIAEDDLCLYRVTDDAAEATQELLGFYRNYHSRRFVGSMLVLRLKAPPTDAEVARLAADFGDIATDGVIRRTGPFPPERNDHPELPRLTLRFDLMHHGRLRMLIDAINALDSAPPVATAPPRGPDAER